MTAGRIGMRYAKRRPAPEFDWNIFDAQPVVIKALMWDFKEYVTEVIDPGDAERVAAKVRKTIADRAAKVHSAKKAREKARAAGCGFHFCWKQPIANAT